MLSTLRQLVNRSQRSLWGVVSVVQRLSQGHNPRRNQHEVFGVVIGVTFGVIALRLSGGLQGAEWFVLDRFLTWTAPRTVDPRILLVTIAEADVATLGHYPIQDRYLAQVIRHIAQGQPAAIGLNLYRSVPVPPGEAELLAALTETPELMGVETLHTSTTMPPIAPPAGLEADRVGFADVIFDGDGVLRRSLLAYRPLNPQPGHPAEVKQSVATRLALRYLEHHGIVASHLNDRTMQWGRSRLSPLQPNSGGYINVNTTGFQILMRDWRTLEQFEQVSLTEVLSQGISPDRIRDRVVLIGTISAAYSSSFLTPILPPPENTPGIVVQANVVSQLLSAATGRSPLRTWSEPWEWLWILLWSGLGSILFQCCQHPEQSRDRFSLAILHPGKPLGLGTGGGSLILLGSAAVASYGGWWIPLVPAGLGFWGSLITQWSRQIWKDRAQTQALLTEYNRVLEQQVVERTAALMRSEAALIQAQSQAHLGSWKLDLGTMELTWSKELFRIFGLNPEQNPPSPSDWLKSIHPHDRAHYQAIWHRLLSEGQGFSLEHRILLEGETLRYVESHGEAILDSQGQLLRVFGSVLDITHRKQIENALRESESHLKTLVANISDGIVILDQQGVIQFANPAAANLFGRSQQALINFEWSFPMSQEEDLDIVDLQGNLRTLESRISDTQWKGKPGYVIALRDVTDRKAIEEQLRCNLSQQEMLLGIVDRMRRTLDLDQIFATTVEELREILHCHRTIIYQFEPEWNGFVVAESVHHPWKPILNTQILDDNYQGDRSVEIDYINRRIHNYAIAPEQCVIKHLQHKQRDPDGYLQSTQGGRYRAGVPFFRVDDIDRAGFSPCYLELLKTMQVKAYVITPIFQGETLWGLLGSYQNDAPRSWQDSDINIMVHISTQLAVAVQQSELMAQLQHQTLALRAAKDSAEEASKAKGTFLANMSHELRTPLNAIAGFAQLLQLDANLTESQQKKISTILRSSDHLLALINDILDVSKTESGQITLNETNFNLDTLLVELIELFRWKAEQQGIVLRIDRDPHLPLRIRSDRLRLRQILMNLFSNAIKFTPNGFVILRAKSLPVRGNMSFCQLPASSPLGTPCILRFEVEDTGLGIAPEEQSTLFQPFVQTESGRRSLTGTGLGLAISRNLANLLGGTLNLRSQLGKGSTFILEFPALALSPEESIAPENKGLFLTQRVVALAPSPIEYRILLVDDQPDNRELLAQRLSGVGFQVKTAANGLEAIDRWQDFAPHAVLMDMRMPLMDGLEATRTIRELEANLILTPPTLILALSASVLEDHEQQALDAGCQAFLTKPIHEDEIFNWLHHSLGIEFIYAQVDRSSDPDELTEASLLDTIQNTSLQWRQSLENAVLDLDERACEALLQEIVPEFPHLAQVLTQYLKQFQYDRILEKLRNVPPV